MDFLNPAEFLRPAIVRYEAERAAALEHSSCAQGWPKLL
jgi:hypothetical protein